MASGISLPIKGMAEEYKLGLMVRDMKDTGKMIRPISEESLSMQTEIFTKVIKY